MNKKSVEKRVAELKRIAERAFKVRFSSIKIVRIDVKPGYDHDPDRAKSWRQSRNAIYSVPFR